MSQTLNINYDPYAPGTFALTFTVNGVAPNLSTGYGATMRIWRSGLPTTAAPDVTVTSPSAIALGTSGSIILDLVVIHAALALVSTTGAVWTYDLIVTPTGAYSQKVCSGQLAEGVGSDQTADVTAPISVNWAGTVGGDLSGTLPNPQVHGLRGRAIVGTSPNDGDVYVWHASNNHWRPEAPSGAVSDGDKGDITVSASGATWTIDASAVTTAKIADLNVTEDKLALQSVGQSQLALAAVSTNRLQDLSVTTAKLANSNVTYPKIQNVTAGNRLLGRAAGAGAGTIQEIAPAGLLELGGLLGDELSLKEGTRGDVTISKSASTIDVISNAITYAKMQDVTAASRLLGRGSASGAGDPQEISLGTGLSMSGTTLSASVGSTVVVNEQTYTANGTFTKSANCRYVIVEMCGGGGGGGSGSTTGPTAGSGGCAGLFLETVIMAADLGTTTTVTVGAGGAAGVNGSDTILTNDTTSTIIAQVQGGRAASNTTWSSVGIVALSGFGSGGGAGATGRHGGNGPGGGGGGGTSSVGAAGGRPRSSLITSNIASGGGGAAGGTGGGAGANATVTIRGYGEGGGGGAQSGGVGANGGNGIRGSGGGGGGAGATSGGTGGTGGDGFVRIIEVQVS